MTKFKIPNKIEKQTRIKNRIIRMTRMKNRGEKITPRMNENTKQDQDVGKDWIGRMARI